MKGQGGFAVFYTDPASDDLLRLFDFLLDRAKTVEDFDHAQEAIDSITEAIAAHLGRTPFIFRKTGTSPFVRELVIPFGQAGYVALYEIQNATTVNILAVRHQREDDYN